MSAQLNTLKSCQSHSRHRRLKLLAAGFKWILVVIVLGQLLDQQRLKWTAATSAKFYEGPGVFPGQILRERGFLVEDHHITTKDKYQIRLTRAWNPLITRPGPERPYGPAPPPCDRGRPNKVPLLMIHGILESFNAWVSNSFGVRPRDFANVSLAWESLNQSLGRLADEPSANSLAMLALNHGHEVWLMSRRGFPGSRTLLGNSVTGDIGENSQTFSGPLAAYFGGLLDLSDLPQYPFSFNRKFWNFSFDEQAQYDVPQAVDFILDKTCRKQLSVVVHSAGGAITLMALSMYPEMNQKIQSTVFWSAASNVGHGDIFNRLAPLRWLLERFQGALPPTFTTEPFQGLAGIVCRHRLLQSSVCARIADLVLGASENEAPLKAEFINALLYSSASHEVAQLLQCVAKGGHMHRYDYGRRRNLKVHGLAQPPPYNLSRITLDKMSFWRSATDFTVTPADVEATMSLLRVPHRAHLIRAPFNHQGFFFHRHVGRLAIIPALREIQQFSERNGAST